MAKLKGRDVSASIEVDGGGREVIALARDADINIDCDIAEFTSPLSGRGKRYRAGRYSWSVNIGTLIDSSPQPALLLELLKSGGAVELTMSVGLPNSDGQICDLRGMAISRRWALGAPLQGLATFDVSFIGDGEIKLFVRRNPTPPVRP